MPPDHMSPDGCLADLDAELEKLAMDPGRTPERIGSAHPPNEIANLAIHRRPPGSRTPTPKQAVALTMPLEDGGRLDQHHCLQTARPQSVEPSPQQAVALTKPRSAGPLPVENGHLMS